MLRIIINLMSLPHTQTRIDTDTYGMCALDTDRKSRCELLIFVVMLCGRVTVFASLPLIDLAACCCCFFIAHTFVLIVNTLV